MDVNALPYLPVGKNGTKPVSWYGNAEEAYDAAADFLTEAELYESPEYVRTYARSVLQRAQETG